GFCGWSFLNAVHELLVIEDMDADARFAANYFVVDPQFTLKFYVAAPLLTTDGHRLASGAHAGGARGGPRCVPCAPAPAASLQAPRCLAVAPRRRGMVVVRAGTLCVMGNKAQRFDATRAQVLANLAEMMVRQLEQKWARQLSNQSDVSAAVQRLRPLGAYDTPYLVVDTASSPWRVLHMNNPAIDMLGVEWGASYAELALHKAGRARSKFDGVPICSVFDLSEATAEWAQGGWEFTLSNVAGAGGAPAAAGRGFTLHFRVPPCPPDGSSHPIHRRQKPSAPPPFNRFGPPEASPRQHPFNRLLSKTISSKRRSLLK
ncbi:mixed lineage protein kinase, partial [Monoraphidium neglectum]